MSILTPLERRILANQYRILSAVNPDEAAHYEYDKIIEVLESGFEAEYGRVLNRVEENLLSVEECQFIGDVLVMISTMLDLYGETNANLAQFQQVGFDVISEFQQKKYADFLFNDHPGGLPGIRSIVDSHHPTLTRYRSMVEAWKRSEQPRHLTEADVARILTASGPA